MNVAPGQLTEIQGCEVCGSDSLTPVLDLGNHPMCDDLIPVGDSRVCREYPIAILYCERCKTAHQRYQIPKEELFPRSYHYRSRFTADVLNGMAGLVESCVATFGDLAGKTVLDIGCNDGSLLDFFRKRGAKTVGIEPTDAFRDAAAKGHATYGEYFASGLAARVLAEHGKPDYITFTNVFAHIEDLRGVLAALRVLLAEQTVLIIENHYLGAVLDGNQFDTFYHEHPRSYSYASFVQMAKDLGVSLLHVEFPARYGGNIRVFLGRARAGFPAVPALQTELTAREQKFAGQFEQLNRNIESWRRVKGGAIDALVARHGPLRAKAFPGRAAILVKLLALDQKSIAAVYEKPGSLKIGNYLPGTRIPILSDEQLFDGAAQDQPIVNLAWHIAREIHGYLRSHGHTGPIIDILDTGDFAAAR